MAKLLCGIILCALFTMQALAQPPQRIKADSTTAILARHHPYTGTELIAQLGYIDMQTATRKEVADNMLMGLVVLPGEDYEVVSFAFSALSKGHDLVGPITLQGNKIWPHAGESSLPGDKYFFDDIRVRRKGSDHIFKLNKGVFIKVVE